MGVVLLSHTTLTPTSSPLKIMNILLNISIISAIGNTIISIISKNLELALPWAIITGLLFVIRRKPRLNMN
jgi:hypothetical protein